LKFSNNSKGLQVISLSLAEKDLPPSWDISTFISVSDMFLRANISSNELIKDSDMGSNESSTFPVCKLMASKKDIDQLVANAIAQFIK
jgi:hypothetical protein